MNFLLNLVPTLIVLGVLILVHEWGHFIACRISGVRVEKFSIGFGPEIFSIQGKETRYTISLFPLGGFVKPAGESVSEISGTPRPDDYLSAPLLKKIFIVVSGVGMNYALSFVLFILIFLSGRPVPLSQVGGFVKNYPAESSGLQVGDRILSLNARPVRTWEEMTAALSNLTITPARLQVSRNASVHVVEIPVKLESVQDVFGETHQVGRLGILPDPGAFEIEKLGMLQAITEAALTEYHLTLMTYKAFFYLATGRLSMKTLSGPIGIMTMTGSAAKKGIVHVLHLMAVLGISLAVINLLPIPALDGGHLLFLLIEGALGRKVSLQFQEKAAQIGFVLLMLLMGFVIYNDLVNLQVLDRVQSFFRS